VDAPQFDPVWVAHAKIAFAALCGGILRLLFRPAASFLKSVWLLFGCVTCGFYGTDPFMRWWEFDATYAGAVGALLGFVGLSLAEALLKALDNLDLKAWAARWSAKGTDA
jgi:hypothetical protein